MSRRRFALLYALAWTPMAALYAFVLRAQRGVDLEGALWGTAFSVGTAAVLGLGAWWVSGRIRWEPGMRARALALHLLLALCYSSLWLLEVGGAIRTQASPAMFEQWSREAAGWQFIYGTVLYGLIAGIAYAVHAARRLRAEERRAARAESLRVQAELRALRAQLDPHFLFNTLHSITALVRMDAAAGEQALERFATLLRYVLEINRDGHDEVALEEELGFVRTYLALERLRYGDRLQVVEEIDPDALECAVLAFTLQPLVENAVRHGITPRAGAGTLRLAARLEGERLVLEVADDGVGADLARVNEARGLGLGVVRQRLEARHGAAARMDVVTAPRNGFLVRLSIPATIAPAMPRGPSGPRSARAIASGLPLRSGASTEAGVGLAVSEKGTP